VTHRLARPQRRWTAIFAVLALLFSQLALAAYVCPGLGSAAGATAMAERMAAGEPCDGMVDSAQPVLCHTHCADAPQSADTAPVPVPALPGLLQAWPMPMGPALLAADAQAPARRAADAAPRPPPEPLFLSTLRLRV
jgi:hypothetical protein